MRNSNCVLPHGLLNLLVLAFLFISPFAQAQCISSTPSSGTLFTDDNTIGNYLFTNPEGAESNDGSGAVANSLVGLFTKNTHYLKVTGFNFNIPSFALICGISVQITRRASGLLLTAAISDNEVRLVNNGTIEGSNYAATGNWSGSWNSPTYGGSSDRWGLSLTPADVNAADFGIAISAKVSSLVSVNPSAEIDHVQVTVYYSIILLPVSLRQFQIDADKNGINCTWTLQGEEENASVALERSTDLNNWKEIVSYPVFLNSHVSGNYDYYDRPETAGTYHYRLKIRSSNGTFHYSYTRSASIEKSNTLKLYPTIASHTVFITQTPGRNIQVYNEMGQAVRIPVEQINTQVVALTVSQLPDGIYFVRTEKETHRFIKKK